MPARRWIKLVTAILLILVMILALTGIVRALSGMLRVHRAGSSGETDPMFAPTPEAVTRPPDLDGDEGNGSAAAEDRSSEWHYDELNPVEKTADELAQEEEALPG